MNRIWGITLEIALVLSLVSCSQKAERPAGGGLPIKGKCAITPLEDGELQQSFELKHREDVNVEIKVISGPPVDFLICDKKGQLKLMKTTTTTHHCNGGYLGIKKEFKQRMTISAGRHYLLISNNRHTSGSEDLEAVSSNIEYLLSSQPVGYQD